MCQRLRKLDKPFHSYYVTRNSKSTAFKSFLKKSGLNSHVTNIHDEGNPQNGLKIDDIIPKFSSENHIYVCGPPGLINAVRTHCKDWPEEHVHFELFEGPDINETSTSNSSFEIILEDTGITLDVPANKTIMEILKENDIPYISSCEQGICGACITEVVDGVPDHRDSCLLDDEKQSGKLITICCSRSKSAQLHLKL
ncbi:MAG: iron-sulfur cluster-binding domain-containing protein [Gammaproteobacteria bacterium]|jgi:vanillate monooxygenase ferredoxin subunit|nr:iron-sulfur cluster-binding domain-containing protein [Gammaproteobacteria bacterium]